LIGLLRSRRRPASRGPRRTAWPFVEALETRTVLSVSITANIGGVTPPVISVTLPQPTRSGTETVSLTLRLSSDEQQLFRDAANGRILHNVSITLSNGKQLNDTIDLRDALIASYRLVAGANSDEPAIDVTLDGLVGRTGSITANIDGTVLPRVVSLTIPQASTFGAQDISLVVKLSEGFSQFYHDAALGEVIPEVEITLDKVGNISTDTISLTDALIASIQFESAGDSPEAEITLVTRPQTIDS
jgi:type VI protein secretion system component Hcp